MTHTTLRLWAAFAFVLFVVFVALPRVNATTTTTTAATTAATTTTTHAHAVATTTTMPTTTTTTTMAATAAFFDPQCQEDENWDTVDYRTPGAVDDIHGVTRMCVAADG